MNETERAVMRVQAYLECVRLVRVAVGVQRMHQQAVGLTAEERAARPELARLPELDLERWYARAEQAVGWLEQTDDGYWEVDP